MVLVGAVVGGIWRAANPSEICWTSWKSDRGRRLRWFGPGSGSTVTSEEDTFAEALAAREESFGAWLSDQGEQLEGTAADVTGASDLVGLAGTVVDGSAATAPVARSTADRLEALLLANLEVLDGSGLTDPGRLRARPAHPARRAVLGSLGARQRRPHTWPRRPRLRVPPPRPPVSAAKHGDRVSALCD
ncbi:MAG: hypothetical protein R2716_07910 [Microthrixaceae bacterium]